jgi:hypothetical protein
MVTVFAMNGGQNLCSTQAAVLTGKISSLGIIIKRIVCMYNNSKRVLWVLLVPLIVLGIYSSVVTGLMNKKPSRECSPGSFF